MQQIVKQTARANPTPTKSTKPAKMSSVPPHSTGKNPFKKAPIQIKVSKALPTQPKEEEYDPFNPTDDKTPPESPKNEDTYDPFDPTLSDEEKDMVENNEKAKTVADKTPDVEQACEKEGYLLNPEIAAKWIEMKKVKLNFIN